MNIIEIEGTEQLVQTIMVIQSLDLSLSFRRVGHLTFFNQKFIWKTIHVTNLFDVSS